MVSSETVYKTKKCLVKSRKRHVISVLCAEDSSTFRRVLKYLCGKYDSEVRKAFARLQRQSHQHYKRP